jgi:DNA-binding IclR family transcriptional regulator
MKPRAPTIQVIDRAARLLDAAAAAGGRATLKALAAETGLHPSTAHRILGALAEAGLVERDDGAGYVLGAKLRALGSRVPRGVDLRGEAIVVMRQLCAELDETVNLTVREGDEVVYIERVSPRRMMRVEQVIGSRAPLHVTAVGKLMLGELGDAFVRSYARRTGLPALTPRTITALGRLLGQAKGSVQDGYAVDAGEAEEGVGCIGVPVRDATGAMVAGLSVSFPLERRRDDWVAKVRAAGRRISERLGHAGP